MVVSAAVVGAGATIYSSNKASKDAKKARKSANSQAQAQLDFEKQKYEEEKQRWEDTFGTVEDNLSDYYENLTPEFAAAKGIQDFEQERSQAMTRVNETFAQRGITGSGVQAATELSSELSSAENKAKIRVDAEQDVIAQQQSFLQMGLNHKADSSGVSNAMNNQTQMAHDQASAAETGAANASGAAAGAAADVAIAAIDKFF